MAFFCDLKVAEISCEYNSDRSNYHQVSVKNKHDNNSASNQCTTAMVEGAKSLFKSTASEIDDKTFRALSNIEAYTILNLI